MARLNFNRETCGTSDDMNLLFPNVLNAYAVVFLTYINISFLCCSPYRHDSRDVMKATKWPINLRGTKINWMNENWQTIGALILSTNLCSKIGKLKLGKKIYYCKRRQGILIYRNQIINTTLHGLEYKSCLLKKS